MCLQIGDARFAAVLEIIAQSTDPQASAFDAWASTRTDVHLGLNQPVSEAPVVTAAPESLRGFASKVMEAAEEGYSKVLATELHVTDAAGWSSLATEEATLVLIGKGPDTLVTSVTAASISSTSVSTGAGSAPTAAKVDRLTVLLGGAMAGAVGVAVAL